MWLATDLDREGEAIAWHVAELLDLDVADTPRVVFDEITEGAILAAFDAPRTLDTDLVDAQQARRAVDRIVGYRLSPVLWRTVSSGISAGRVQSVALRLIVDREDEIRAFVPEEYWSFDGILEGEQPPPFEARLYTVADERIVSAKKWAETDEDRRDGLLVVRDEDAAEAIVARAEDLDYRVTEVKRTERKRKPNAPFKTSTLQGAASKRGFSARQTMAVAQQLYEGIQLGGEQTGLITYMRTDSLNLSDNALEQINDVRRRGVRQRLLHRQAPPLRPRSQGRPGGPRGDPPDLDRAHPGGGQAVPHQRPVQALRADLVSAPWPPRWPRPCSTASRPTSPASTPDGEAIVWRVTGQVEKFDGWFRAYREEKDEDEQSDDDLVSDALPPIEEGMQLHLTRDERRAVASPPRRRATPSGRWSRRSRSSASAGPRPTPRSSRRWRTASTSARSRAGSSPRPLGEVVVAFLKNHFTEIVDVEFTARMEETLDEIAAGSRGLGTHGLQLPRRGRRVGPGAQARAATPAAAAPDRVPRVRRPDGEGVLRQVQAVVRVVLALARLRGHRAAARRRHRR